MRRLVAPCLLLAACASNEPPAVRACQAQANDDPEVRHMIAASAGSEVYALQHYDDLRDARRRAELKCLRARGLAPPGGVEAPVRSRSLFEGL